MTNETSTDRRRRVAVGLAMAGVGGVQTAYALLRSDAVLAALGVAYGSVGVAYARREART